MYLALAALFFLQVTLLGLIKISAVTPDLGSMFVIFIFGVMSWLAYGILTDSAPIIVANCVTLLLAGSILFMKLKYNK